MTILNGERAREVMAASLDQGVNPLVEHVPLFPQSFIDRLLDYAHREKEEES